MRFLTSLLAGLLWVAAPAAAQQGSYVQDCFLGLNNTDLPSVIGKCEAQDLMNVESNLAGTALKKRGGFTREAALTVSTSPVTGSYRFKCSNGDEARIVCNDRACAKSVNNGAFSTFLSTATSGVTRWVFVTVDSILYGFNDQRDKPFTYDCTTLAYSNTLPRGSVAELTGDRLVVSDTAADPNQMAYSASGDFTNHTTGIDKEDAWTDDLGAPGERTTALKFCNGLLYRFTERSMSACEVGDQYTTACSILSDQVGMLDPNAIVCTPQGLYFTAADRNYWRYGTAGLENVSKKITGFTRNLSAGQTRSNTQTTQADWEAGSQTPSESWNTATRSGSIFTSSVTHTDNTAVAFSSGAFDFNVSTNSNNTLSISISTGISWENAGGEVGTQDYRNWVRAGTRWTWSGGASCNVGGVPSGLSPVQGTGVWFLNNASDTSTCGTTVSIAVLNGATDEPLTTRTVTLSQTNSAFSFTPIDTSTYAVATVKLKFSHTGSAGLQTFTSSAIVRGQFIPLWTSQCWHAGPDCGFVFDIDETIPQSTSGTYTSRCFDTGFSTPTWGTFNVTMSSSVSSQLSFQTKVSSSCTGTFDAPVSVTPGSKVTSASKPALKYIASYTLSKATDTPASITSLSLAAATTGQFRSACIQPGSGVNTWGILSCSETNLGAGSLVYYATSAVSCAALPSTPPTSWQTSVTNNATLNISTNAAVYVGMRSLLGSATDQAQLDACTLYWTEGAAVQPVWSAYDAINNSVFWTATTTGASSGNRVVKYDLNHEQFYLFDLSASALLAERGFLYFGSSSGGYWNKYGTLGVDTDNGAAINAFWKGKDLTLGNPFQEKKFLSLSVLAENKRTGSITVTPSWGRGSSISYSISTSTDATKPYIRSNYALPAASAHSFFNVQFGNNAGSQPFSIFGFRLDFMQEPWRVLSP